MSKPEILEQRPVSVAEVKDILKQVHKRDEELSFRGGKTEDYANEAATLTLKKTKELIKRLEELEIPRLREQHCIKIADTLPEHPEQLKVILSGYNVTIVKENLKKIIDVVNDFQPEK